MPQPKSFFLQSVTGVKYSASDQISQAEQACEVSGHSKELCRDISVSLTYSTFITYIEPTDCSGCVALINVDLLPVSVSLSCACVDCFYQ